MAQFMLFITNKKKEVHMKKVFVATALITALMASTALAWGPYWQGKGYGKVKTYGGFYNSNVTQPVTDEQAQKAVESFLATNLKGFEVKESQKVQAPRGTVYFYKVSDGKTNYEIHVNPWGYVAGPFPLFQ